MAAFFVGIPGPITVIPAIPQPSFPRKRESGGGQTATGWSFQYRRDSRLRGNDDRGSGMTVGRHREGR